MKKKILLSVVAIIIIVLALVFLLFRNEISLVYNFLFVSEQKAQDDYQTSKSALKDSLVSEYEIDKTLSEGFTKEEMDKLSKGEITVDEVMSRITEKNDTVKSESNTKDAKKQKINAAVSKATAEMYRLQGVYYSKLGAFESEVISFYNAQIAGGATKTRAKTMIIGTFSGRLYAMEAEADANVEAVLSELTKKLKSLGGDTGIVSKMRTEYQNQKKAKIAQYRGKM